MLLGLDFIVLGARVGVAKLLSGCCDKWSFNTFVFCKKYINEVAEDTILCPLGVKDTQYTNTLPHLCRL